MAGRLLLSYVDSLHRSASKKLRCGVALACCDPDDVITAVAPDEWHSSGTFDSGAGASQVISEPTAPAEWVDTPEILARFAEGLPLIETQVHSVARRVGPACKLEDLRAAGREGLLDAARSFNDQRRVPFDRWASMRIRSSMFDAARRTGAVPVRVRQRLQAAAQKVATESVMEDPLGVGAASATHGAHAPLWVGLEEHQETASLAEGVEGRGLTPEDVLAKAELVSLVRGVIPKLPTLERALIERSYFGGLTLAQAAAEMGVSRSWAHRVHERAMDTIAREVRKGDPSSRKGRARREDV